MPRTKLRFAISAGLQAGLEELKTIHAHLAEDSRRLIDYQRQTMLINESIWKAQDDTAKMIKTKILKDEPPVSRSMLQEMFREWTTRFLAQLNDDTSTKHHDNFRAILAPLLSNLDGVVLSMKNHIKLVSECHTSQARNVTLMIHQLNETNVKQRKTQDITSLVTHDLGLLAKQCETIVDAIKPVAATEKPTVTCNPVANLVDIKPGVFKRLKSKELDQLGSDVARLRQLTHDDFVAKQAVADAQATRDISSACYTATCLHARQAADS